MGIGEKFNLLSDVMSDILTDLQNHPCFDEDLFAKRDWDDIAVVGGDIADITGWAIRIAEALEEVDG